MIKQTSCGVATVCTKTRYIPIARNPPAYNQRVILIDRKAGIACVSQYLRGSHWTHWHPLPTFGEDDGTNT